MSEQLFERIGECNQCGECCSDLPWGLLPSRIRNWRLEDFESGHAVSALIPFKEVKDLEDHNIVPKKTHGSIKHGQRVFWYIFTEEGLHKDLEPHGDPATVSQECPFLLADSGDGKRPCGLVGTRSEYIWNDHCREMARGVPPHQATEEVIRTWFEYHPSCSFKYNGFSIGELQ